MPFKTHPELAKMFRDLSASTCAACILLGADVSHKEALIQTFEHLAGQAGHLTLATCAACRAYKAVIRPA